MTRRTRGWTGPAKTVSLAVTKASGEKTKKAMAKLNAKAKLNGTSVQTALVEVLNDSLPDLPEKKEALPVTT